MMKTKVEVRRFTPQECAVWLDNLLEGQRKRRESHVQRLAEDMRLGRFKLSPDAILIVKKKLANGQHRFEAVVVSGLAQDFLVMETDDEELYKVLDDGIRRTIADILPSAVENTNDAVAIARLVCAYDKKLLSLFGGSMGKLGRQDILEFEQAHRSEIAEAIHLVRPLQRQTPIVPASIMAAVLVLGQRVNTDRSRAFVEAVYSGSERNSATWLFRERMINNASTKTSRLPRSYVFALALKALKNYCNGNQMGVLKMAQGESFPEL